jgi:hypothetical protein
MADKTSFINELITYGVISVNATTIQPYDSNVLYIYNDNTIVMTQNEQKWVRKTKVDKNIKNNLLREDYDTNIKK